MQQCTESAESLVYYHILNELEEIRKLRHMGRWLRDIGDNQLMHAAYRSARLRLRDIAVAVGRSTA